MPSIKNGVGEMEKEEEERKKKTLRDAVTSNTRVAPLKVVKKTKQGLTDLVYVAQFAGTLHEECPNFRIFPVKSSLSG